MNRILVILVLLSFISCVNRKDDRINDISDKEFNRISKVVDMSYSIILSESESGGPHWEFKIEKANKLRSSISQILKAIDDGVVINKDFVKTIVNSEGLLDYLPNGFNALPLNYKKLIIINYEQNSLNEIVNACLHTGFRYLWVLAEVESEMDTIRLGDEFSAEISIKASNFRDSVYIYDNHDSLVFTSVDSLGYVHFIMQDSTKGDKVYYGYYKSSFLNEVKLPKFTIEYYVE